MADATATGARSGARAATSAPAPAGGSWRSRPAIEVRIHEDQRLIAVHALVHGSGQRSLMRGHRQVRRTTVTPKRAFARRVVGRNGGACTGAQRGAPRTGHLLGRGQALGCSGAAVHLAAPAGPLDECTHGFVGDSVSGNTTDRIRRHLVDLKMPRALGALQRTLSRIGQGEVTALDAIVTLLDEEYTTRASRRFKMALQPRGRP